MRRWFYQFFRVLLRELWIDVDPTGNNRRFSMSRPNLFEFSATEVLDSAANASRLGIRLRGKQHS
jgi:hypothetical protein